MGKRLYLAASIEIGGIAQAVSSRNFQKWGWGGGGGGAEIYIDL